jgi:hypothetical protein
MATATKKEKKRRSPLEKAGASSGHTTKFKKSILRLSISMGKMVGRTVPKKISK